MVQMSIPAKSKLVSQIEDMIQDKCEYFWYSIKPITPLWIKNEFRKMIMEDLNMGNYDEFLTASVETIDVYGTGMTFLLALQYLEDYMPSEIVDTMRGIFLDAVHPNVFNRYSAETLLAHYDTIMSDWIKPVNQPKSVNQPKMCKDTQEWNPRTRRCNKKCGRNSHRNENFKCVRNTTRRQKKM